MEGEGGERGAAALGPGRERGERQVPVPLPVVSRSHSRFSSRCCPQCRTRAQSQCCCRARSRCYSQPHSRCFSRCYSRVHSQCYSRIHSWCYSRIYSRIYSQCYSRCCSRIYSRVYSQCYSRCCSRCRSRPLPRCRHRLNLVPPAPPSAGEGSGLRPGSGGGGGARCRGLSVCPARGCPGSGLSPRCPSARARSPGRAGPWCRARPHGSAAASEPRPARGPEPRRGRR